MEPEIPTIVPAPLSLFEIKDPRGSRYWEMRTSDECIVRFWPSSFHREFYHDDLSEREPGLVEDFWRVYALIEAETKERVHAD